MKFMAFLVFIIGLAILPVIIIGTKYFDGVVAKNSYEKGLAYKTKHNDKPLIEWDTKVNCSNNICTVSVLKNESLNFDNIEAFFRPPIGQEFQKANVTLSDKDNETKGYSLDFAVAHSGWYIVKVDFIMSGVKSESEKAYFISNKQLNGGII